MKKQAYQVPELRDASNNIVQAGTYGRTSPLVNADNTGILDYVNNNLEALHDAQTSGNGVRAAADTNGQAIDIAALKKLITDTVTQAKKDAILAAHPVGSYYISDNATDPGTLFGGTWTMLDPGLTLISQGKGSDKFGSFEFVAGQTYGERMHQLTGRILSIIHLITLVVIGLITTSSHQEPLTSGFARPDCRGVGKTQAFWVRKKEYPRL